MKALKISVVGGGISGLTSAYHLALQGVDVTVFEANDRLGGRIHSPEHLSDNFDIGPSWFWPGQTHIENLIKELKLTASVFKQYAQGDALYETIDTKIHRGVQGISMAGSCRVKGGLGVLVNALQSKIVELCGDQAIQLSSVVTQLEMKKDGIQLMLSNKKTVKADKVIMALPPRVAISSIDFAPVLSVERVKELNKVATWMAGHAKAIIIYDTTFWREQGLSGDAVSQRGPLSEIHDASTHSGQPALFGFFATPPAQRESVKVKIDSIILEQLLRLFGDEASQPMAILYKDWAKDSRVATPLDQHIPNHHPSNSVSEIVEPDWQSRLIWSGSETALGHYNGYIEGAIMSSRVAVNLALQ
jgi:monoamine oxidase